MALELQLTPTEGQPGKKFQRWNSREASGGTKVETNDGTTKAGLPCEEESKAMEDCGETLDPEASKADACELKSWLGTPPNTGSEYPLVRATATLEGKDDD